MQHLGSWAVQPACVYFALQTYLEVGQTGIFLMERIVSPKIVLFFCSKNLGQDSHSCHSRLSPNSLQNPKNPKILNILLDFFFLYIFNQGGIFFLPLIKSAIWVIQYSELLYFRILGQMIKKREMRSLSTTYIVLETNFQNI